MKNTLTQPALIQLVQTISNHVQEWPIEDAQISGMELISKTASHPTVKEWDRLQWENLCDTIIAQQKFIIQLRNIVQGMRPDELKYFLQYPSPSEADHEQPK